MRRVIAILSSSLVISLGLLTMWGLFPGSPVNPVSTVLVRLAVVVGAVAVLVGLLNLLWVHVHRVVDGEAGWVYSVALVLSALLVIVLTVLERTGAVTGSSPSGFLFDAVQVSVESALAGLLVFFLVFAAGRLLRYRVSWSGVLFILTLLIVLVGWMQIPALNAFNGVSEWIRTVPASAGARGLLLGVALGVTTAGVRVLLGQDPSYRE
jgi:hypothetical protein